MPRKQINMKIDEELWRNARSQAVKEGIQLRDWIANAIKICLDFDKYAKDHCLNLGWKPKETLVEER